MGVCLAQIGEFAFVLLSRASNLGLVQRKLYLLLLGTTALSIVSTPMLFRAIPYLVRLGTLMRWLRREEGDEGLELPQQVHRDRRRAPVRARCFAPPWRTTERQGRPTRAEMSSGDDR